LLRYLSSEQFAAGAAGGTLSRDQPDGTGASRALRLGGQGLPEIALLTLGCPLRQLYAARFPTLYRWVLERRGRVTGPLASDIGVSRWINAYCSGDYVGRWLWSASAEPAKGDSLGRPMTDSVDPKAFGRSLAYDGLSPLDHAVEPFKSEKEIELCLGFGAHTHYFEPGMQEVAWIVDHLLAHPRASSEVATPSDSASRRPSPWHTVIAGLAIGLAVVAAARL
jgi:hypothetical protein